MDADQLFQTELQRRGVSTVRELSEPDVIELGLRFAIWLPQQTFLETPWLAPFAVRRIRIRTDANAPGPPRDLWGFPNSLGYFTDDNSLIKGVVRGRRAVASSSPYGDHKLSTGLVCCHVWPGTTADPLLFSFVPNLVWLPRSLAGFSDAHYRARDPHPLHFALHAVSHERFRQLTPRVAAKRTIMSWRKLRPPSVQRITLPHGLAIELSGADTISRAANRRIERVVDFLSELDCGRIPARRVSRRYHAGIGARIDPTVPAVQSFVDPLTLRSLRDDLRDVHSSST